jgi:chemotaxis protein methyltransferase CheR
MNSGMTKFFRNSAQLKTLEYCVIPRVLSEKEKIGCYTLRVWSAGCATGEEPYTVAIICRDLLPANYRLEISASDLDAEALLAAERAVYSRSRALDVPPRYLRRYFSREPGGYRLCNSIKETVTFIRQDLTTYSGLVNQDIVFLRNVGIYHDERAFRIILAGIWRSMSAGGYLFVGDSESPFAADSRFEYVNNDFSALYRKIRS